MTGDVPWSSAVTVSLVPEARGGPFVFWDSLPEAFRQARELGFDAVELFVADSQAVERAELTQLLDDHQLKIAAFGTGAGWVVQRLHLLDESASRRRQAEEYIRRMIELAGEFHAPAIIGSMQGRWTSPGTRQEAWDLLTESLGRLSQCASEYSVPLVYEPLNRYETNVCNTIRDGLDLIRSGELVNVRLLADLFHMNIEEADIASALRLGGRAIGHVHFADSNRRAAGLGHLDWNSVIVALREIGYRGYLSAEVLPYPDPIEAARQTITHFRHLTTTEPA